jgi:FMN-dependent NADH-azoreductase
MPVNRVDRHKVAIANIHDRFVDMTTILRLNSSARTADSVSRQLVDRLIDRAGDGVTLVDRDLSGGVPLLIESTLGAMFTPADARNDEQVAALAQADQMIAELVDADAIVIGLPIYNFGPPAALKAWADLVARVGVTFQYGATGAEGLVPNKPVYVVVASGGVPVGSPMDLASTWLTTFLGFLGLTDVTVIAADQLNVDPEGALAAAQAKVDSADVAALSAA